MTEFGRGARTRAFADLRDWISWLEARGEVKRISADVDWDLEIGGITRVVHALEGPALLFENIKGYQDTRGRRLFVGGLGSYARLAAMLGLAMDAPLTAVIERCRNAYGQQLKPILVSTGPVKENILLGDDVDLYQFPVPRWHHRDGGRYIDTFCGVVTKDPVTGESNIGLYRGMLAGKNKIAKLLIRGQHWHTHLLRYQEMGKPMPVAIVYGWDDALPFCACSPLAHRGYSEWDVVGAIRGEPVQLVKCETVDLEVPASAEIVVEGTISADPSSFEMEGPFGEYTGYCEGKASPKPTVDVQCITHRNDPILRGLLEGIRGGYPNESCHITAIRTSALAWNILDDAGVPGVTDVWSTPTTSGTNTIIQIRKQFRGHAKLVANALWGSKGSIHSFKNLIVVEEDIDIRSWEDIDWAIAFRVNAGEPGDLMVFGPTRGSILDPSTRKEERDPAVFGVGKVHRVLIDATRNWDYPRREEYGGHVYPPVNKLSVKVERQVASRWQEYGIGIDYLTEEQRQKLTLENVMEVLPDVGRD